MNIQQKNVKLETRSFEDAMRLINEHGEDFAYMSAHRFDDKYFADKQGNVHYISFSTEELLKCYMEKIEHCSAMLVKINPVNEQDSYTNYSDQLKLYKQCILDLFDELNM